MRLVMIVALIAACFLSACSPATPPEQAAESPSPSSVAPQTAREPQATTPTVSSDSRPSAAGVPQATDGPPAAPGAPIPYFGEASIEERIATRDIIVRASLDLTARDVTTEVIRGQGEIASDYYYVSLKLPFTVNEYLKGSGGDNITVVSIWGRNFDTEAKAEAAAPGFVADRISTWDNSEAIIFINQDDPDGHYSTAVQGADTYYLGSSGLYTLNNRYRKLWLPAADVAATGDSQEFMIALPVEGEVTPTITLGELKRQITAVNTRLNAGDGSEAYKDCVKLKYQIDRLEQYRLGHLPSNPHPNERLHSFEPSVVGDVATGQPAGLEVFYYRSGGWANPATTTDRVWFTGTDASLFEVKHGPQTPGADHDKDGVSDGFNFDLSIVSTRPFPAGTYEFISNRIPHSFLPCEATYSFPVTATLELPDGVLHELFFDPVMVGSSIAADDTNGVLKPASFTGADGSPATIGRIAYEPSSAGSERAGTVKLAITAGSHPDDVLGVGSLDFIELDGSVSLSLEVFDASVDNVNKVLSWTVASQPWEDGDQLMVRIRTAPPSCKSRSVIPDARNASGLVSDCETLLGLKGELVGTGTLNWSVDTAMTGWDGVTVRGTPQRVTRLRLERKGLTGSIPGALGRLTHLKALKLQANRLTGPIPRELGALTNLVFLHLFNNSLSGPISSELGSLTALYDLFLQNNALTGPIPPEMGNMAELGRLWLSGNQLSGTIPAELTGLTSLTLLLLHGNPIVGCLPPSLKDIATNDLSTLRLRDCLDGPPAPTGLNASLAVGTFTVTWTAISGVDEYEVQWRIAGAGDSWAALPAVTTATATYAPTGGLECSSTYEFRVRAHGDGFTYPTHWGTESGSESAATSSCPPAFDEARYAFEVAEDAAVGDAVGTVSATDPDEGDTLSYSITAGNGDGKFNIDDGTGEITVAASLDHETADEYTLTVEADDGNGATSTVTVTVTVTDVAEDPSFDEASYAFEVAEDVAVNDAVGTVTATDPDEDDEVSYAITAGNGDGKFNIDDGTGAITVAASLDHETVDAYTLTVEANDGDGGTATVTVTVTVTDVVEDPSFDEARYAFEVAEDAAVGDAVGTVSATDPDEDDDVSYSITAGNGDGKFNIDDGTGAITMTASLDHETTDEYTLTVEASDGQNGTATVTVMVTVTDVAEAPSFDETSYAFEVGEDASSGDAVGTVSATDPDEDDTVGYAITAGNADGKFAIDDGTGAITVAATLDHETADEYVLTVEADDGSGGTATVTVTVTVTDVVESPPPPPTGLTATLVEGVFTVSWTALDGTAKYEVQHRTDAANSQWTALPETADPSVTHAPADGPVCSTEYRFRVRAYGDGDTYAEMWGVESDVEPVETATCPPEFDNASYYFFIRDTAAVNSAVGSVSATDPDQGDALSYAITAGNGDGKFSINGTTGQLTVSGAFDIGATPYYTLTVEASDGQGGKDSAEVTVSLTIAGCYNGTAVPRADERPLLVRDCSVLLSAKDTLRGTASLNWSPDVSIDEWQGVSRANIYENHDDGTFTVTTYVKSLIVSRLGLNGSIPPVLAGLVDLRRLDLNRNQLTGEIPSELGRLSGIRNLSLSDNLLTGEIPPELGNLPILEDLRLHRNQLTGEIPSELRRLGSLRILIFNDNRLNGSIPSWFGELAELRQLWLRDNELTGSIPSELAGLDLEHLHLSGNSLSGCIPSGLRDVANNDLDRLGLADCTSPGNS